MSIVLARIDNRLIHGQVLESWVPFSQANCIVVANDQIAARPLQKTMMAAAVPSSIRVAIGSLTEVAELFASGAFDSARVLLLFASAADALRARQGGVAFAEINLGNLHGGEGKQRYSCTIALDAADIASLSQLEGDGVRVVARCIPSDNECDWHRLLQGGER